MTAHPVIVFAGGGTGGHIFPNLAIFEALQQRVFERGGQVAAHLMLSDRPLDAELAQKHQLPFTPLPVRPLRLSWDWWSRWRHSVALARQRLADPAVCGVVATGGFVSGPAIVAANELGKPVAMVNLDATPGKANRALSRKASVVFSVHPGLRHARLIRMPLRRASLGPPTRDEARALLGLDPDRDTILILGGSQGAKTLDEALAHLAQTYPHSEHFRRVQWLHVTASPAREAVERAYAQAGWSAKVLPFIDAVGAAWRAADLAISRAGAGGVAEAAANHTPTLFLPYPFHRDQHQRKNAQPLVDAGAARLITDYRHAGRTAAALMEAMTDLLDHPQRLREMRTALAALPAESGADAVAAVAASWLLTRGAGEGA